jgi:MFS family permease
MPIDSPARSRSTGAPEGRDHQQRSRRHHGLGFWVVAATFLVVMGFSAVPTPLYAIYAQRDHFSTITVTVVFAVYAVGVIGSLFLAGHVSDWVGRRRVLLAALGFTLASAAVFLLAPSVPGLIVARIVNGVGVGLTTATATAYLAELHVGSTSSPSERKTQVVATAANLGGIGFGPLVAGLLAQYVGHPLVLPYLVFVVAMVVLAGLVALSPETATRPAVTPRWRPQRIAVPANARGQFLAATGTGLAAFAVYGMFTSLAPSLLAGPLHESSHAVAGAVVFAAFASGAAAQILVRTSEVSTNLRLGAVVLVPGLVLLSAAMWAASLPLFVLGGIVTGAAGGLLFRGAMSAAARTAPPEARAETLAGFFLGAYVGLSVPVIGLGIATQYASARSAMLVFAVLVLATQLGCVRALLRRQAAAA